MTKRNDVASVGRGHGRSKRIVNALRHCASKQMDNRSAYTNWHHFSFGSAANFMVEFMTAVNHASRQLGSSKESQGGGSVTPIPKKRPGSIVFELPS